MRMWHGSIVTQISSVPVEQTTNHGLIKDNKNIIKNHIIATRNSSSSPYSFFKAIHKAGNRMVRTISWVLHVQKQTQSVETSGTSFVNKSDIWFWPSGPLCITCQAKHLANCLSERQSWLVNLALRCGHRNPLEFLFISLFLFVNSCIGAIETPWKALAHNGYTA